MTSSEILQGFESLVSDCKKRKIPFHKPENENVICVSTQIGGQEDIIHIHWEPVEGIIQFIHILPLVVPAKLRNKMLILLNRINLALPNCGFTLDEKNGIITYKLCAFLNEIGRIHSSMIFGVIDISIRTVKEILPQLQQATASAEDPHISSLFENSSKEK